MISLDLTIPYRNRYIPAGLTLYLGWSLVAYIMAELSGFMHHVFSYLWQLKPLTTNQS